MSGVTAAQEYSLQIRHLRSFLHVAELGSISAAAKRLNLAQPVLSRQIRMLEDEFGTSLFRRDGRGVELNEHGKTALERISRIVSEWDATREELRTAKQQLTGKISIGFPPTLAYLVSNILVDRVQTECPNIRLQILAGYGGHVLDWLHRGVIDIGLVYDNTLEDRTLKRYPLLVERLCLVEKPSGEPLGQPIPFASIANRRLVMPSLQHGLRILAEATARQCNIDLNVVVETESHPVLIGMIRSGVGATISHRLSVHEDHKKGLLDARPIVDPVMTRRLQLVVPKDRASSKALRWCIATMEDIIQTEVKAGRWMGDILPEESESA